MLPCINQIGEGWWGGVSAGPQEPGAVNGHTDHLGPLGDQAQPGLLQLPLQNAGLCSSTACWQRSVDILTVAQIFTGALFNSIDVFFLDCWLLLQYLLPFLTPTCKYIFLWTNRMQLKLSFLRLKIMKQVCSHVSNEDKQISSQSLFMQSFFCIFYRNASKCKPQFQLSYHFFKYFW